MPIQANIKRASFWDSDSSEINKPGAILSGAILGTSIGGMPGAIVGAIAGAIVVMLVGKTQRGKAR